MLDTIKDLAREKSSEKRRELLGYVADLFFNGSEHHTEQESLIFRDIVLRMLDTVDVGGRASFSAQAAPRADLPNEVARQLAQDDVSVAGPMLQHSPVLTDQDFIEFSQILPASHLESIAQRESLSGEVTDALIEHGTREVWHKVTQNIGAEITPKGFDTLVGNADGDEILQFNLSSRPDIPEKAAKNLLPLLPEEGKKRLAKLFADNPDIAGALLDDANKQVMEQKLAGRQGRIETKLLISAIREKKMELSNALVQLVEGERAADIVLLLAEFAELDEPIVSNALYQNSDEPIAILCKSIEVSSNAFAKLMSLRTEKLGKSLTEAGRTVARYKEMEVTSAQRAMRFVQMRKGLAEQQPN